MRGLLGVSKDIKVRHGSDVFTKFWFESSCKFSVPLDADVSVEVVVTRKSNTIRNSSALYYNVQLF